MAKISKNCASVVMIDLNMQAHVKETNKYCIFHQSASHGNQSRFRSAYNMRMVPAALTDVRPSHASKSLHHHHHQQRLDDASARRNGASRNDWYVAFDATGTPMAGWRNWKANPAVFNCSVFNTEYSPPTLYQPAIVPGLSDSHMRHIFSEMKLKIAPIQSTTTTSTTMASVVRSGIAARKAARRKLRKHSSVRKSAFSDRQRVTDRFFDKLAMEQSDSNDIDSDDGVVGDGADKLDFDSFLKETERLLAAPQSVNDDYASVHQDEDSVLKAATTAKHSSTHSTFILLDSGGWKEIILK